MKNRYLVFLVVTSVVSLVLTAWINLFGNMLMGILVGWLAGLNLSRPPKLTTVRIWSDFIASVESVPFLIAVISPVILVNLMPGGGNPMIEWWWVSFSVIAFAIAFWIGRFYARPSH